MEEQKDVERTKEWIRKAIPIPTTKHPSSTSFTSKPLQTNLYSPLQENSSHFRPYRTPSPKLWTAKSIRWAYSQGNSGNQANNQGYPVLGASSQYRAFPSQGKNDHYTGQHIHGNKGSLKCRLGPSKSVFAFLGQYCGSGSRRGRFVDTFLGSWLLILEESDKEDSWLCWVFMALLVLCFDITFVCV